MTRRVRYMYLRDGAVAVEGSPAAYTVTWVPLRADHPDAPEMVVRRSDADAELTIAWARGFFDGRDDRDLVEVIIESEADRLEQDVLLEILDGSGVTAIVRANYERRSASQLPWIMIVKAPLIAFVSAVAAKAGGDAWEALRATLDRIYEARRRPDRRHGAIVIDGGGRRVVLADDLPDEAGQSLVDGKLPASGYVVWDADEGVWRC